VPYTVEACESAIAAVETLQGMISQGYIIRLQEVDHRIFIFTNHFIRGSKAGQGRSLAEAVLDLHLHEENL
jgi:hypothetical protein